MLLATKKMISDIDEYAERELGIDGMALMYNAGRSAASEILSLIGESARAVVLCGKGKNGGDGYVIASELYEAGHSVCVFESETEQRDAASAHWRDVYLARQGEVYLLSDTEALAAACAEADVILDALFGVGFRGELPTVEAEAVRIANSTDTLRVALDIPSGAEADTGRVCEGCFSAHCTITMEYVKRGMLLYPARGMTGEVRVCSIGVDREKVEVRFSFADATVDREMIERYLLARPAVSHKGTFGRALLICGSDSMTGAAVLACEGALRMGAGLCELVCTERVASVVAVRCPEVIFTTVPSAEKWNEDTFYTILERVRNADTVVLGCGVGVHKNIRRLTKRILSSEGCPMLIDADGINSLDGDIGALERTARDVVITPHPKEFARLIGAECRDVLSDKYALTLGLAERCGITVLLKGADSVTASGDGRCYINTTGNSGLARGGSGDVLSGMIGAMLAQGIPAPEAAAIGAHIHGAAADLLSEELGEVGMLPRDIPRAAAVYLSSI